MKVITKMLQIEDKKFYLIEDKTEDGRQYFATIPYEATEDSRLIKELNGAEMCLSFESIAEAIENRKFDVAVKRIAKDLIADGYTEFMATCIAGMMYYDEPQAKIDETIKAMAKFDIA